MQVRRNGNAPNALTDTAYQDCKALFFAPLGPSPVWMMQVEVHYLLHMSPSAHCFPKCRECYSSAQWWGWGTWTSCPQRSSNVRTVPCRIFHRASIGLQIYRSLCFLEYAATNKGLIPAAIWRIGSQALMQLRWYRSRASWPRIGQIVISLR